MFLHYTLNECGKFITKERDAVEAMHKYILCLCIVLMYKCLNTTNELLQMEIWTVKSLVVLDLK